jgi:hypothetical protein
MSSTVTFPIVVPYPLNVSSAKRMVNVCLTEYSVDAVAKELVRCLALFPNLHTVQLFSNLWYMDSVRHVSLAFKNKLFPSVRTVGFNEFLYPITASFPEARSVSLISPYNTMLLSQLSQDCPKLEVLRGLQNRDHRYSELIQSQCYPLFI